MPEGKCSSSPVRIPHFTAPLLRRSQRYVRPIVQWALKHENIVACPPHAAPDSLLNCIAPALRTRKRNPALRHVRTRARALRPPITSPPTTRPCDPHAVAETAPWLHTRTCTRRPRPLSIS